MSMEQRITTLEDIAQIVLAELRRSNEAMQRYRAAAILRDEAMLQLADSVDAMQVSNQRLDASNQQLRESMARSESAVRRMRATMEQLQEASREEAEAIERHGRAIQALMSMVPVTQAEIVRLDSRIDSLLDQ